MKRLFLFAALSVCAAFPQTASYPASVVSDTQLPVGVNQVHLRLGAAISATDTSITLVSGSGLSSLADLKVNMQLNIDKEILWVCGVSGSTVSIGRSSCPNADGRGFDGTTAAIHLQKADVYGYLNAWHVNALKAEIKAIEQALGPNLGNVNVVRNMGQFDFTPQQPGVTLSLGYNTVALTPCPTGLNGSDSNHWLRISGGTGTAEVVLIAGGTCTSGAATGTIVFAAANTHSGSWQIGSATAGLQEALLASSGGTISVAASTYTLYAHVTIPSHSTIRGSGQGNTTFRMSGYADSAQQFTHCYGSACADAGGLSVFITPAAGASNVVLSDFTIDEQNTATSIFSTQIALYNCTDCQVESVSITNAKAVGPPITVLGAGSNHASVRNSAITGTGSGPCSGGIFVQGTAILVEGNRSYNTCDEAFVASGSGSLVSKDITFRANSCDTSSPACFHAEGASKVNFEGNFCRSGGKCYTSGEGSSYITFQGNRAEDSTYGFSVDGGITNAAFSDIKIIDNVIDGTQQHGIIINPAFGAARVQILRNTIRRVGLDGSDSWSGIWVRSYLRGDAGTQQTLDTLTIEANHIYDTGTSGQVNSGIAFSPYGTESIANNVAIVGNQITNTTSGSSRTQDYGIRVSCIGCAVNTFKRWTIKDNRVSNHPTANFFFEGLGREDIESLVFGPNVTDGADSTVTFRPREESYRTNGTLGLPSINALSGVPDGASVFCTDCRHTSPCTGSGSGALATKENGVWNCGGTSAGGGTTPNVINVKDYGAQGDGTADDTSAVQNAINHATGANLVFPTGRYKISSTLTLVGGIRLSGPGGNLTNLGTGPAQIEFTSPNTTLFSGRTVNNFVIENLKLVRSGATSTSGSIAIDSYYDGTNNSALALRLQNLEVEGFYNGVRVDGSYNAYIENVQVTGSKQDGFVLKGAQGTCKTLLATSNAGNGITVTAATNNTNVPCAISGGTQTYNNGGWGISIAGGFSTISDSFFNNDALGEVLVSAPGVSQAGIISNLNLQYAGSSLSWSNSGSAPGIRVAAGSGAVTITGTNLYTCAGNCVDLLSDGNRMIGGYVEGAGTYAVNISGVANTVQGVKSDTRWSVAGNQNVIIGNDVSEGGSNPAITIASGTDIVFAGNRAYGTNAASVASGVTLVEGANSLIGTVSNAGKRATYSAKLVPDVLVTAAFADLSSINPDNAPMLVFCSNCTADSAPCSGSGSGAQAQYKPGYGWACGH